MAEEYAETTNGENPDWDKRGDEIVGRMIEGSTAGSKQESLLRYHRPLIEDGRIAYEFYYEPGKVMVHPALDRLAFLIEPDGVKVHLLTDGAFERNGLAGGNTRDEPENRRGPASVPLKPNAWNNLILSVAGDKVALELNGQAIYGAAWNRPTSGVSACSTSPTRLRSGYALSATRDIGLAACPKTSGRSQTRHLGACG